MDKAKGVVKSGWHPSGKDGKKESWRGDFKGINQVAGWVGKGKNQSPLEAAQDHQSRPLATLKDPGAFGPPPKNVNYHGGAAVPNAITPDRRGLGAPLSAQEIHAQNELEESEKRALEQAAQKPAPPPIPYRVDTTGLSTEALPKPPLRRIEAVDPSSPHSSLQPARPATKPRPPLPPQLPPRESTTPLRESLPPASSAARGSLATSGLKQDALNRLGSTGISVRELNIGGQPEVQTADHGRDVNRSSTSNPDQKPTLSELHQRFSGLSTSSPVRETSPDKGTSFAQKQAALKTASSFRKDPSSISFSDAKTAAETADNFRQRHGEQVASGLKGANAVNQKYDVTGKLGGHSRDLSAKDETLSSPSAVDVLNSASITEKKKPPPPPPKRGRGTGASLKSSPPPIPLSSKPHP
ncbi:MAG: hypothetical protein Q9195_004274 [Heterodermia aff. obscurata]